MKTKIVTLGIVLSTLFCFSAFADGAGKAKFQAAFAACKTTLTQQLPGGYTHADMKSCLESEGIDVTKFHHHHRRFWKQVKACVANAGVTLPAFTPGVKPTLTTAQQTAVNTCKAQVKAAWQAKHSGSTGSTGSPTTTTN